MLVNTLGVLTGFLSLFIGFAAFKPGALDNLIKTIFGDDVPPKLMKIVEKIVSEAKSVAILLIIIGAIIFLISLLGCCGVCCNKLKYMKAYVFLFSIIVVLLILMIAFTVWRSEWAIKAMVAGGKYLMLNFHKRINRDALNSVQKYGKCCGVIKSVRNKQNFRDF